MNKLGVWKEFELIQILFYAFMMILVSLIIIVGFGFGLNKDVEVSNLEKGIVEHRLFSSPDCFVYFDDYGFFVRGAINLTNFNEDRINKCFSYPVGEIIGIKLDLKDFDGNLIKTIEINKELASQRITCGYNDKYTCYSDKKYVLYFEDGIRKGGFLNIVLVKEND